MPGSPTSSVLVLTPCSKIASRKDSGTPHPWSATSTMTSSPSSLRYSSMVLLPCGFFKLASKALSSKFPTMAANSVLSSPAGNWRSWLPSTRFKVKPSSRARCALPKRSPATCRSSNEPRRLSISCCCACDSPFTIAKARSYSFICNRPLSVDIQFRCSWRNVRKLSTYCLICVSWAFSVLISSLLRKLMMAPSSSFPERIAARLAITLRPLKVQMTSWRFSSICSVKNPAGSTTSLIGFPSHCLPGELKPSIFRALRLIAVIKPSGSTAINPSYTEPNKASCWRTTRAIWWGSIPSICRRIWVANIHDSSIRIIKIKTKTPPIGNKKSNRQLSILLTKYPNETTPITLPCSSKIGVLARIAIPIEPFPVMK